MRANESYWSDFAAKCREELLGNVMPFWMKYGWDRKNGGVYTCLDRDGSLMDTTKSVWFQGRFSCAAGGGVVLYLRIWSPAGNGRA